MRRIGNTRSVPATGIAVCGRLNTVLEALLAATAFGAAFLAAGFAFDFLLDFDFFADFFAFAIMAPKSGARKTGAPCG
jgi:hypothetical protein